MSLTGIINIEGVDGTGKHTTAMALAKKFKNAAVISFPDYSTPTGQLVKSFLNGDIMGNPTKVDPYIASMIFAIDRNVYFTNHFKELASQYDILIFDRSYLSNFFFQFPKMLKSFNNIVDFEDYLTGLKSAYAYTADQKEYMKSIRTKPRKQFNPNEFSERILYESLVEVNGFESRITEFINRQFDTELMLRKFMDVPVVNLYLYHPDNEMNMRLIAHRGEQIDQNESYDNIHKVDLFAKTIWNIMPYISNLLQSSSKFYSYDRIPCSDKESLKPDTVEEIVDTCLKHIQFRPEFKDNELYIKEEDTNHVV